MERKESLKECMMATWHDICHPYYQLMSKSMWDSVRDKAKTKEGDVEMVYELVLDGDLKLEDYRFACNELVKCFTGE